MCEAKRGVSTNQIKQKKLTQKWHNNQIHIHKRVEARIYLKAKSKGWIAIGFHPKFSTQNRYIGRRPIYILLYKSFFFNI